MKAKPIFWKIYPSFFAITVAAVAAVTWYADTAIWNFYLEETRLHMEQSAWIIADRMAPLLGDGKQPGLIDSLARKPLDSSKPASRSSFPPARS